MKDEKADYEEMERKAREDAKVYNETREMIRQATGEVWVLQCCVCRQFFDYDTREEIEEPPENALISHMYCDRCFDDAMVAVLAEADDRMANPGAHLFDKNVDKIGRPHRN